MITRNNRKAQAGFALMEMMVVLVILAGLGALAATYMTRSADDAINKTFAASMTAVAKAGRLYAVANETAIRAGATATRTVDVTVAQLVTGDFLPAGFEFQNPYGQTALVRFTEPATGPLRMIVITRGGRPLDGLNARYVAMAMGFAGGYVSEADTSVARGAFGELELTSMGGSPGAGHVVYAGFVADEAVLDDSLKRSARAGEPERNRMNTAIDMAGNNISDAGAVRADSVSGSLEHTRGYFKLGSYSTGAYGEGEGRLWWNANSGNLNVLDSRGGRGNLTIGGIGASGTITTSSSITATGDVATSNTLVGSVLEVDNAYNSSWYRTVGNGGWYSQTHRGGWYMQDSTWIRAYNNKGVLTGGEVRGGTVRSTGDVVADDDLVAQNNLGVRNDATIDRNISVGNRVTAGEYLLPHGRATCNASCATNGLIGRTTAGQLASCVSRTWRCMTFSTGGGGSDPDPIPTQGCLPDYPPTGCPVGYTPITHGCRNTRTGINMVCP